MLAKRAFDVRGISSLVCNNDSKQPLQRYPEAVSVSNLVDILFERIFLPIEEVCAWLFGFTPARERNTALQNWPALWRKYCYHWVIRLQTRRTFRSMKKVSRIGDQLFEFRKSPRAILTNSSNTTNCIIRWIVPQRLEEDKQTHRRLRIFQFHTHHWSFVSMLRVPMYKSLCKVRSGYHRFRISQIAQPREWTSCKRLLDSEPRYRY